MAQLIPLATVELALGALKSAFEFFCTPEGQEVCKSVRENRKVWDESWVAISAQIKAIGK